ncbi:unnamed protein product [Acanthoscelides obtectus]|nr:unnamed protein product [Acanthoscelides obtectus]CAK1641063.1 hypothetical protein AOBTE_LOCUS12119 [Acanthoscelides obtectus]
MSSELQAAFLLVQSVLERDILVLDQSSDMNQSWRIIYHYIYKLDFNKDLYRFVRRFANCVLVHLNYPKLLFDIDHGAPVLCLQDIHSSAMPKEPTRRSIWVSLLGFEKDHQFPKYAYVCSKHFQKSDFVIMPDGARHLKCDAVPTAVHSAFDLTKSASSESSLSLSSFSSPGKEQIGNSSSSEPHSEIDILGITATSADGGPVVKRLRFEDIVADVKSDVQLQRPKNSYRFKKSTG